RGDREGMSLQLRPEHHDADGRRNEEQPEMLAESARHFIERSVHAPAQREEAEQQDEADDRAGNQGQEEMRDELAQPLKKQDLNEAGDHGRTILPRFYPGPLDRSLKIHAKSGTAAATAMLRRLQLQQAAPASVFSAGTQHALCSSSLCCFASGIQHAP